MVDRTECEQIVRQLWPYLDGAVPELWRERIVAHLEQCENCRSHFDYEREFLVAVRAAETVPGEFDELQERVLAALTTAGFSMPGEDGRE